ncbi:MAG: DinB family protein [Tepidiformaceae bacterium]
MAGPVEFAREVLAGARRMFGENVRTLTLEEALSAAGGYRSILGVLKHTGGWAHVYRSYAFDREPRHWADTAWPRGLRDTIDPSQEYLHEVVAWVDDGLRLWDDALAAVGPGALDRPHPVHWGATAPLSDIVLLVSQHVVYHAGELNMLLSIARGEAWEYTEEVEENHISTYGHGIRGEWMSDNQAHRHEEAMRRAHELRGGEQGRNQ